MVSLIPIAMLAAAYSQPLARAVWKRASAFVRLSFSDGLPAAFLLLSLRAGRTTPRSFKDRFKVSLSILAYLSFVGLLHTATLGSISRQPFCDSYPYQFPSSCVRRRKDPLTGRLVMLANWREPIGTIGPFSALWVCRSAVGMCGCVDLASVCTMHVCPNCVSVCLWLGE